MDNKTITISTAPRLAGMLLAFVFLLAGQMLFAQSKQVTGVVKDVTGETVIGASVVEKGTANGTITDFDGNFKLTVGDKAVLQISFVGYQTQEINTVGKTSFVVTLKEDSEMLEEVVVVGYGEQKVLWELSRKYLPRSCSNLLPPTYPKPLPVRYQVSSHHRLPVLPVRMIHKSISVVVLHLPVMPNHLYW